jgi:hypothetical protein
MSTESVWAKLSPINVNENTESKGGFTYLSWAWAWKSVKDNYPDANFQLLEDLVYPGGTMEVRVSVTINGLTHTAFLPVLNHKNAPIVGPNAFEINTSRMRCLVKAIAFHGLGLYIYAGEDIPAPPPVTFTTEQREQFLSILASDDGWAMKDFARHVGADVLTELFNSAPAGQKVKMKDAYRAMVGGANDAMKSYINALDECETLSSAEELFAEMEPLTKEFVLAGLSDITKRKLETLGVMA